MAKTEFTKEKLDKIEKKLKENAYNRYACPNCDEEDDIEWEFLDYADNGPEQEAKCEKCGFKWTEHYTIASVSFENRQVEVTEED